ncbi:MAG: hypothetical protein AAFZ15_14235 [Bacteroidota bacterium]
MTLSHFFLLATTQPQDRNIIRILSNAFKDNQRMRVLIGNKKKGFHKCIRVVISFCYLMVKKWNGIFITADKNTYLLYYQKNEYRFSAYDLLHYLYMAFFVIGILRLPMVFKREKKVKQTRHLQVQKKRDHDYLYVWFLANKENFRGMNGLVEVKNFLLKKSSELNVPVYIETTDERLLSMYQRAGFEFYHEMYDEDADIKIWFGRLQAPSKTKWKDALVKNLATYRKRHFSNN